MIHLTNIVFYHILLFSLWFSGSDVSLL